jgi:hypothetical protein
MDKAAVKQLADKMNRAGVPGDYGPGMSRLLNRIWREVAEGRLVTPERAHEIITVLGVSGVEAHAFLDKMAEKDDNGNIIGILGLSQDARWAHGLTVNGMALRTWCAWDQFFLAQVLNQTVLGESRCPVSDREIKITISPGGVRSCEPSTAVVSIVTLDPDKHDKRKLEELWSGL